MEKKVVLKDMEPKKRAAYIWEYYKWYFICGGLAVIIIAYFIVHYATLKDSLAGVLMVNADPAAVTEDDTSLFDSFLEDNGYDTDKQEITVNNGIVVDPDATDANSLYTFQSVQTIMTAHGADVFLSDEEMFELMASVGELQDITTILSPDLIEEYKDSLYYVTDEESGVEYACGIVITGNEWTKETALYPRDCVIGAVNGTKNSEMAEKVIAYILSGN